MKHIKSYGNGALLGSMSTVLVLALAGCSNPQEESISQSKFIIVQETALGKYEVIEETPINGPTRIMVKNIDGTMRELSEEEMKNLAQQEYAKVQQGTSETLNPDQGSQGMGLAGTILAVAAGSILGNMIANQLMGNKNFAQNNRAASSHARSLNRSSTPSSSSQKKSFFGKTGSSQTQNKSFLGG